MTNNEKDKQYEFAKLCMSLTKQGARFRRHKLIKYALVFDKVSARMLSHPNTKMPFVNSTVLVSIDKNSICYKFHQWADEFEIKRTQKRF